MVELRGVSMMDEESGSARGLAGPGICLLVIGD